MSCKRLESKRRIYGMADRRAAAKPDDLLVDGPSCGHIVEAPDGDAVRGSKETADTGLVFRSSYSRPIQPERIITESNRLLLPPRYI